MKTGFYIGLLIGVFIAYFTITVVKADYLGGNTGGNFSIDTVTKSLGIGTTTPTKTFTIWGEELVSATSTASVYNATSTTSTSTAANGWNISAGCFSINGVCVGGGGVGGSGTVTSITLGGGLDGATPITTSGTITTQVGTSSVPSIGNVAYWQGNGTPSNLGSIATTSETCTSPVSCAAHAVLTGGGAISLTTVPVTLGGTGQTSFAQGWLNISNTGAFQASTSPTVKYITATSTTATSTFGGAISVATSSLVGILNLGTKANNGTTTIFMGKIQIDGYNLSGVRVCMMIAANNNWFSITGACANP